MLSGGRAFLFPFESIPERVLGLLCSEEVNVGLEMAVFMPCGLTGPSVAPRENRVRDPGQTTDHFLGLAIYDTNMPDLPSHFGHSYIFTLFFYLLFRPNCL